MAGDISDNPISPSGWRDLLDSTPEHLRDNPLVLFFRCKYNDRDQLMNTFCTVAQESIEIELRNIDQSRSRLTQDDESLGLAKGLSHSRNVWRAFAKSRCSVEKQRVRRLAEGALSHSKSEGYFRDALRILDKVEDWKDVINPPQPDGRPGLGNDKGDGFLVHRVVLKKRNPSGQGPISSSYDDCNLKSYPLEDVLYEKGNNPLTDSCQEDAIQYFHFPANDMVWVEEAISRYYGEDRGEYNYREKLNYRPKSSDLLCGEFWTGQQQGHASDPAHARHMRSQCSMVSSEHNFTNNPSQNTAAPEIDKGGKSFVIFMPYLHWETDTNRRKMAQAMVEATQKHRRYVQNSLPYSREDVREKFVQLAAKLRTKYTETVELPYDRKIDRKATLKPSQLGQYLLDAATLYDAMDVEPDVRLLRQHLHPLEHPPLHPRRTLDQSYHWKQESTELRDQDQVVYRHTKADSRIRRTAKLVMVDQLWLYVLDDKTVISFFPKRWGKHNPDFSGVYEAIQSRLENARVSSIQSVYDLALTIMDQCSNVFFDQPKQADGRPQVLHIFSTAISQVHKMQETAFEIFWRHLDKPLQTMAYQHTHGINPEAMLLREEHDIVEELRMMSRIYKQQLSVAKQFSNALLDFNKQEVYSTSEELKRISHSDTQTSMLHNSIPVGTLNRTRKLINNMEIRLNEYQDLEERTKELITELQELLSLKQQQASIINEIMALRGADRSLTQGRSLMTFTIITIIFLPLSFMSSIFGMNARELSGPDGGVMSLKYQFKVIFPVSVGLIVLSLILAFSSWIQDVLAFLWRQPGVIGLKIKMRRNRSQNRRAKEQAIIIERGMGGWGV